MIEYNLAAPSIMCRFFLIMMSPRYLAPLSLNWERSRGGRRYLRQRYRQKRLTAAVETTNRPDLARLRKESVSRRETVPSFRKQPSETPGAFCFISVLCSESNRRGREVKVRKFLLKITQEKCQRRHTQTANISYFSSICFRFFSVSFMMYYLLLLSAG